MSGSGKLLIILSLQLLANVVTSEKEGLYCEAGVCTRISNEPIDDPCNKDTHDQCAFWAQIGECDVNPKYMLSDCALSCGACPSLGDEEENWTTRIGLSGDTPCTDTADIEECERLAGLGQCSLDHDFMWTNCKATCITCVNENDLKAKGLSHDEIDRQKRYLSMKQGVEQSEPSRDQVEEYHTIAQIVAMEKYAKMTMTEPSTSNEIRSTCKNSIQECAYYASKGLCYADLTFMMNNCPLACMMCEHIETFHQCVGKRHPSKTPFLVKEEDDTHIDLAEERGSISLSSFFEHLRLEDNHTVHVITEPAKERNLIEANDPYIFQIDDILTPEECDEFIEMGNTVGWKNSTVDKYDNFNGKHDYQIPQRISETAQCGTSEACIEKFNSIIQKFVSLLEVPAAHFEIPQVDRYPPGGYYTAHHDFRKHDEYKPAGPRVLSIYLVLSEATSGGSIGFPNMEFMLVKPRRGSLLILPNVGGKLHHDKLLEKEIMPVREGDLYMLHTHVHLFALASPTEKACE